MFTGETAGVATSAQVCMGKMEIEAQAETERI